MVKRRAEREKIIAGERPRITKLYGEQPDYVIEQILAAEREIAQCANCKGLPCRKTSGKEVIPTINVEDGALFISRGQCEFDAAATRQKTLARLLKSSHLPDIYADKTYADYRVDTENAAAVAYAKSALETRQGAFLYGNCGTGKTFLAALIAKDFLKAGKGVVFEKVPRLLADIRNTFGDKSELTESQVINAACNAELLILDDFGMEKPTKFAGTTLCTIIDARFDRPDLTTIITSNYPLERIRQELDNASDGASSNGSRIADRCRAICKPILLKGNSRRQ